MMPQKRKAQCVSACSYSGSGSAKFAINLCCQKTLQPGSIIGNYVHLKIFSLSHYLSILLNHKQLILPMMQDLE